MRVAARRGSIVEHSTLVGYSILVVEKAPSIGVNTAGQHAAGATDYPLNTPHGALLGHYDMRAGTLYLLKQGFKDHCSRIGASAVSQAVRRRSSSGCSFMSTAVRSGSEDAHRRRERPASLASPD